jgi:hypothetical protein
MMFGMSDKSWKAVERRIALYFPKGRRRGADYRGEQGGKTDIIAPGWSIEVKQSKRPTYGLMCEAVAQAERNRVNPADIPVAVIHRQGDRYGDSLVIMRLEEFAAHFIGQTENRSEE